MDDLKDIPDAKYVMDDLIERIYKAEQDLISHKEKSIQLIHEIIKNISILQIQTTDIFCHDRSQFSKKERAIDNLIKLAEMNS